MIPDNPFVSNADPVNTKHFIGRKQEIKGKISKAVFDHESPLNLSIIGIPNIGKTSLINNAVLACKDDLKKRGVYPIVLDFSIIGDPLIFFRLLARNTLKHLKENNLYQDKVQKMEDSVTTEMTKENLINITEFFQEVEKTRNFHALFILDRFDHAKSVLKDLAYFNLLRNLASKPCLSFLILSCRSVMDIEKGITGSFSPFGKSFEAPLRLKMFDNDDVAIYFKKYKDIGIPISEGDKNRILSYCGRHPYLLQSLGYKIVDMYSSTKRIDVAAAAAAISDEDVFLNYYRRLTNFLEEVELLLPLNQILSGNLTSVDSEAKKELEKYGLISYETETENYVAYSEGFHKYLSELHRASAKTPLKSISSSEPLDTNRQALERSTESAATLGSLGSSYQSNSSTRNTWEQTEIALRKTITTIMSIKLGGDWIDLVSETNDDLKNIFDKCKQKQELDTGNYPGENTNLPDLIDYTNPEDIFKIILHDNLWEYFREFFGKAEPDTDKNWINHWDQAKRMILHRVRHPSSHSNESHIPKFAMQTAAGYCGEILEICEKVEQSMSFEQDPRAKSRIVQTEEASQGTNVMDRDQERIEQEESKQEKLYKGKVFAFNQEEAYANIRIDGHESLQWTRVQKCYFQNEAAFGPGKRVKFKIEETSNGLQVRNVDLDEDE